MKHLLILTLTLCATGCTLFRKDTDDNEMFRITDKVLERKEGIDIIIQPIPVGKR